MGQVLRISFTYKRKVGKNCIIDFKNGGSLLKSHCQMDSGSSIASDNIGVITNKIHHINPVPLTNTFAPLCKGKEIIEGPTQNTSDAKVDACKIRKCSETQNQKSHDKVSKTLLPSVRRLQQFTQTLTLIFLIPPMTNMTLTSSSNPNTKISWIKLKIVQSPNSGTRKPRINMDLFHWATKPSQILT